MKIKDAEPLYIPGNQICSVLEGGEAFAFQHVQKETNCQLHIARNDARLSALAQTMAFFNPEVEVVLFPAWDCVPYDRVSPSVQVSSLRLKALSRLAAAKSAAKKTLIITTINALVQRVPPKEVFTEASLHLTRGTKSARENIVNFLVRSSYHNAGTATEPGEFALRGSIMDIIPVGGDNQGYRLDFFGDELETIRRFDPLTQISSAVVNELLIAPASEVPLDDASIARFRQGYREQFGAVQLNDPLYEAISEKRKYAGAEHWLPLFFKHMETLFDYLPDGAQISADHLIPEALQERLNLIEDHYEGRKELRVAASQMEAAYKPLSPEALYLMPDEILKCFTKQKLFHFHPFQLPESSSVFNLQQQAAPNVFVESKQTQRSIFDCLADWLAQQHTRKVLLMCSSDGSRQRMQHMLQNQDIPTAMIESWAEVKALPAGGAVGLALLNMEQGFSNSQYAFLSEQDVLGEKIIRSGKKANFSEKFLAEANNFIPGDFVVHREHGIGRFDRLETLTVGGGQHDCLKLIYEGGDRLYVPVENIDLISRYGAEEGEVQLDRLGGVAWQGRKARLKERIKVTAGELLKVAAERQLKEAEKLEVPEEAYEQFCTRFPYAETEDQLRTISEVEADLVSGRPMDRLVCGDVGFGKTEVALRAAFIASQSGGQVAVIAPTTLLCRQHFKTFSERFQGFPVKIRQLSRMVTNKNATQTRKEIEEGQVDIVIGTHALLAKTIHFKNLNLMIVDEEQHFGVKQKEALKRLRAETHVLSLSATPIPRTLQLSLTGVRDLSLITTPPVDRLAVRTYVMPFDPMILREAILREHFRGGRTFYVCPRISDLDDIKLKLASLVPEVKVAIAHGQMNPTELDDIMNGFFEGTYDVLLSTSIIESGIDISTANTLIVHRSDMFGLAQLYQIRGRVGRSKVRAYAYITLPPGRLLTKQATKRLEVMQTLDTLGAGFTLASHDMDIRGFGNLLGDEQSGNIKEVGVELYQQMLEETIAAMRAEIAGEKAEQESFSPHINLGTSVLIPEDYVEDTGLRVSLYRRIAGLKDEAQIEAMASELIDRFGPIPAEVEHLLDIVKIKLLCYRCGIEKVEAGPQGAMLTFCNSNFVNPQALLKLIAAEPMAYKLKPDNKLVLIGRKWDKVPERFKGLHASISQLSTLAA
jgi:transcription-repair coupling factor (superfamily II helicase)